jgi:hypothetical protein
MSDERYNERNVQFEVVSAERVPFGKNNFLEIARKKAVSETGTTEFISLSRGYTMKDGSERYKSSIGIPDDPEIRKFLADKIANL